MRISHQKVVSIHYELISDSGEVIDSSKGKEPLTYLHGSGQIIQGLENALLDKEKGNQFNIAISPEEGYGRRSDKLVKKVSLSQFENKKQVKVGVQFEIQGGHGFQIGTVTKIEDDEVTLDLNHPLADQTLHFDVTVTDVRDATQEELDHGHVHGPGGHHH